MTAAGVAKVRETGRTAVANVDAVARGAVGAGWCGALHCLARLGKDRVSVQATAVSTPPAHPRIPYGEADFRRIRLNRWLYVDKTRFLRRLEQERYAFLIRPRRFGKSLWVSLLENYYDRFWADGFAPPSPAPTSGSARPGNRAATSPCASTSRWSTTSSKPWSGSSRPTA